MDPEKSGPGRPPVGWKPDSRLTPAPGAGVGAGAGVNAVYKIINKGFTYISVLYIYTCFSRFFLHWGMLVGVETKFFN